MLELSQEQQAQLGSLVHKLESGHTRLRQLWGSSTEYAAARSAEFSNVFGVLGPRGAGKSTLLSRFYRDQQHGPNPLMDKLLVIRPLDCSTVLQGVEPGMAILLHLEPQIRNSHPNLDADLWNDLDGIISIYLHMTNDFRGLKVDLASSPSSFGKSLVKDVKNRLGLGTKLADWLAKLFKGIERYEALVILLDDFDLIPADDVRSWFRCLFDDLHQTRLLFVLTGDFHRLEHLIFDPKAEIDDKTGRSQLEKLLPWQHRVTLEPWKGEISLEFGQTDLRLKSLLEDQKIWPISRRMLMRLLPSWPRGLENLYKSLETEKQQAEQGPGTKKLLVLLATCRGEPLWARRLEEHELDNWEGILQLTATDLPFEDWRQTVRAARQRCDEEFDALVKPLRGLTPVSAGRGDSRLRHLTSDFQVKSRVVRLENAENHSTSDPLRHDELWAAPLRDTEALSEPYWVELLLDLSFSEIVEDNEWRLRNRIRFLDQWHPAKEKLAAAKISVALSTQQIRAFFDDYNDEEGLDLGSLLFWLNWKRQPNGQFADVTIGWPALLEGLRKRKFALSTQEVSDLSLDIHSLWRPREKFDATVLEIVPDRVWASVLLVDALDRCCWDAFSDQLGWHLPTYLALAGALIQSAYAYALVTSGLAKESSFAPAQQRMVQVLQNRHPGFILGDKAEEQYEAAVFSRLREVLCSPFPQSTPGNPLQKAAVAFFTIAPYKALVKMIRDQGLLF